jgi:hypothetical protein
MEFHFLFEPSAAVGEGVIEVLPEGFGFRPSQSTTLSNDHCNAPRMQRDQARLRILRGRVRARHIKFSEANTR